MKINIISVGSKMPHWITEGFHEYAKRMPTQCSLNLIEIPLTKRTKSSDINKLIAQEGESMLSKISRDALVIALDVKGESWNTQQLADNLKNWMQSGQNVYLLIGGPEGLSPACLARAKIKWSLSPLTFPHALVRILVSEQLYRALSILEGHPYHK